MNLEEIQEKLLQTEENFNTLNEDYKLIKEQLEEKENRIKELESYNQKLFLRATATQKQVEVKEKYNSTLLGDYIDLLSDEEIEILKEIEEDL